jgi:hypothetical protein
MGEYRLYTNERVFARYYGRRSLYSPLACAIHHVLMTVKTKNEGYLVSLTRATNKSLWIAYWPLRRNMRNDNTGLYLRKTIVTLSCTSF